MAPAGKVGRGKLWGRGLVPGRGFWALDLGLHKLALWGKVGELLKNPVLPVVKLRPGEGQ